MEKGLTLNSTSLIIGICLRIILIIMGMLVIVIIIPIDYFTDYQLSEEDYRFLKKMIVMLPIFFIFDTAVIHYQQKLYKTWWIRVFNDITQILLAIGGIFSVMAYFYSIWNIAYWIGADTRIEAIILSFTLFIITSYTARKIGIVLAKMVFSDKEKKYPDYQYFYDGNDVFP